MTAKTILFNDGWSFCLTEADAAKTPAELSDWHEVQVPHDFLIGDTANLYKTCDGWYKKTFSAAKDGRYFLSFDGVYMNCAIFVNGKEAGGNTYGYAPFEVEITDFVQDGENEVAVLVRHRAPNSRWYSGAGIFRDVELKIRPQTFLRTGGVYIHTEKTEEDTFTAEVDTDLCGEAGRVHLTIQVISPKGDITGFQQSVLFGGGCETITNVFTVQNPMLWDVDTPDCYILRVTLYDKDGTELDMAEEPFGFKTAEFSPEKGFLLNGRQLKLHGVCMHHDLGALGAAYNLSALYRQMKIMKEMGVNAIRTSHNMPSKQLMDICDNLGLLVLTESFDMWEHPKTEFDNARFFAQNAEECVKAWVERDRNRASLLAWSIGNEIPDTNSPRGVEVCRMLNDYVRKYDYKGNAPATHASNFMENENAHKCTDILGLAGYNYAERLYDGHHAQHPEWVIYGSETSSAVRSRGIYHFPASLPQLTHEDMQCSDLDNSCVGWGSPAIKAWVMDRDRDYCAGQFVWTGFDYIGEPTPYTTKNSYFGAVDTAGFPKDIYYFYQSVWRDPKEKTVLHIAPSYWDFNEGQEIDVIVYSNAAKVELFLNGKLVGSKALDILRDADPCARFSVRYEKGVLRAAGYDESGTLVAEQSIKSVTDPVKLSLSPDKETILADGRDICFIEINALDASGTPVGNARNRVKVEVSGAGRLVGLDNGDSTDYDSYKGDNRRLFSGRLLAMVQSTLEAGEITVKAVSEGLREAIVTINSEQSEETEGVSVAEHYPAVKSEYRPEVPVRKIELSIEGDGVLTKAAPTAKIKARLLPFGATYSDISWRAVRTNGMEAPFATVTPESGGALVTAVGDGECFIRAFVNNGSGVPQVFADIPVKVEGVGAALKDPYSFMSAGKFDSSDIPARVVEDGAVGGVQARTAVTFRSLDFGKAGSDTIKLHIGVCGDIPFELLLGGADGEVLLGDKFKNNGLWSGFAPQEFKLSRLVRGVQSITVVIDRGIIFGGFEFLPIDRAFAMNSPADADELYGDDYRIEGSAVLGIGNNVSIGFTGLDFGEAGVNRLVINGATENESNSVQLRYKKDGGEQVSVLLKFDRSIKPTERGFKIPLLRGAYDITFLFLPGSKFDFYGFRFENSDE